MGARDSHRAHGKGILPEGQNHASCGRPRTQSTGAERERRLAAGVGDGDSMDGRLIGAGCEIIAGHRPRYDALVCSPAISRIAKNGPNVFRSTESMFYLINDASKVAFFHLIRRMKEWGFDFLDAQIKSPHLVNWGAQEVTRERYLEILKKTLRRETRRGKW